MVMTVIARAFVAAVVVAIAFPAVAAAGTSGYPPAETPGGGSGVERGGKRETFRVCKRGCRFRTIQGAVNAAGPGDTVRVSPGVYREGVRILGRGKRNLKLIGDRRRPARVIIDGRGLRGARAQNGVIINNADNVTVAGFKARNFKANGFFAVNVDGYLLTNLIAEANGAYGVYAFNSLGGVMADSKAYWHNDSGFYVGQTPPQRRPKRTVVRNVDSFENELGFSGTNMRYVTITRSRWFNNGLGIVPNSLDSERFPPPSRNVIVDNDIFWNNFNYYAGAPFEIDKEAKGLNAYPIGTGILLFGGQDHTIENNRIYGNWLMGVAAITQILQGPTPSDPTAQRGVLKGNVVRNNVFGLGGRDLNGRDMFYDGSGERNCFAGNRTLSPNVPADNSTFAPCPGPALNTFNEAARNEGVSWVLTPTRSDPDSYEQFWIRHPHARRRGIVPVVRCAQNRRCAAGMRRVDNGGGGGGGEGGGARTVQLGDFFYRPAEMTVPVNTRIVWRWPNTPGEPHDVALRRGPRGVPRFRSEVASSDFTYSRTLTRRGRYDIYCTLHPVVMRQTITVE
jgi:plastocyanin